MRPEVTCERGGVRVALAEAVDLPLGSAVRDLAGSAEEAEALQALDELWQDGLVETLRPGQWVVPYDRLMMVEAATARALELPTPDDRVRCDLRSQGTYTSADFRIEMESFHPVLGRLPETHREGPAFLLEDGQCVLLGSDLWKLVACVSDRPDREATTEDRSEYVSRCVELAECAGAEVDDYLRQNRHPVLQDVDLEVTEEGDEIVLGARSGDFHHHDLVAGGRPLSYPTLRGPDGVRKRAVASRQVREAVRSIDERRRIQGAEVPQFLLNPEAFLPEQVRLDLEDFSKRVRGFRTRVYNSRPYIHVRREPRGWLEFETGVTLEPATEGGDEDGTPSLSPDEYRDIVQTACGTGGRFVRRGDHWIEVDPEKAEQFLDTHDALTAQASPGNRLTTKVVLDVIPNVDLLEFEVELPEVTPGHRPWMEGLPEIQPPPSFDAQLDEHQLLGFRWLCFLHDRGAGGLLADEMGVGKTAQAIALLTRLKEEESLTPTLIVLPKTLIPNWHQELRRFAPSIQRIWEHAGPGRSRSHDFLSGMEVVLTTYETARSDQVLLGKIDWKVVIADEAQFIKNPTAARTAVLKALKARQPLALTGTPVENGLIEFWCIMDYVRSGLLRSWSDFRREYARPLVQAGDESRRSELVEELLHRLEPHYLRRLKAEVMRGLPEKSVERIQVPLGKLQEERYRAIISEAREQGRDAVLGAITKLLMTCSHPRAGFGDWEDVDEQELGAECPKLAATLEILQQVRSRDEKAVIFTTWKSTQKILQRAIWADLGISANIVNGDLTTRRQEVIDDFRRQSGFGVMILGPEVAGFGLNLVEANHVIHYTRPWNPAKENQATDRVHRRGQGKPVTVYYPIVTGTVEDKLAQLLADKEQLAHDVLRSSRERTVTREDLVDAIEAAPAS